MSAKDKLSFCETVQNNTAFVKGKNDYVILFKGNSITSHGFNEKTNKELGWDHRSGMAASSEENDYVHIFAAKVQSFLFGKKVRIVLGQGGRPDISILGLNAEKHLNPDLIVIQNGEHSAFFPQVEQFEKGHETLILALKKLFPDSMILSLGIWNPRCRKEFFSCTAPEYDECAKRIEQMQRETAQKTGIGFAAVSPYENNPENTGSGKVAGVRWHPNDSGMKCYADVLFQEYLRLIK